MATGKDVELANAPVITQPSPRAVLRELMPFLGVPSKLCVQPADVYADVPATRQLLRAEKQKTCWFLQELALAKGIHYRGMESMRKELAFYKEQNAFLRNQSQDLNDTLTSAEHVVWTRQRKPSQLQTFPLLKNEKIPTALQHLLEKPCIDVSMALFRNGEAD